MTVLLMVAAVVLDGGLMLVERRHAQADADAAALAAAVSLGSDSSPWTTTYSAATNVGDVNYTSTTNLKITPHVPPTSGQFAGVTTDANGFSYVEVIVEWDQARYFSAIFGSGNIPIKARAVARTGHSPLNLSILVLSTSASGALTASGGTSITVPGTVVVDSTSGSALTVSGGSTQIISQSGIQVDGGINGSNVYAPTSGSTTGVSQNTGLTVPDPLASLAVPSMTPIISSATGWTAGSVPNTPWKPTGSSGAFSLSPGYYAGGIQVGGSANVVLNANADGSPGIYYFDGPLTWNSSGTLSGSNIMIYVAPGSHTQGISFTSGVLNISPPTSGAYSGISLFMDRTSTAKVAISGGSGTNVGGVVYAAKAAATISGGSNITPGSAFITDTLTVSGGSFILPSSPVQVQDLSKHDIRLVE